MDDLALYIPLGIVGLIRWVTWFVRRIPASFYRPIINDHVEALSIVTPVYQEDPETFRRALRSWLANRNVSEIICVIDATDVTSRQIAEAHPVRVLVTDVPGKRDALRRGWEAARTPLVALVDSDTIWAQDTSERVCEPFADPRVGGVGTRQNVLNPTSIWQHFNDMYLDYRYFDENPAQSATGMAVSCLSGRTAVYRRELLLDVSDDFMSETFLGVPCNSGDDKRLTTLLLERGHLTCFQRSARVWSTFPSDARGFFRQRVRWGRNTWRSDLRALFRGWVFRYRFLAFTMIDKAVSPFTLLLAPTFFVVAVVRGDWFVAGLLVAWWVVSRSAKVLPHLRRRPRSVGIMPAYIGLTFVMALVKLYALTTIRAQRWLTRDVAVVRGSIARTVEPALARTHEAVGP